MIWLGGFIGFVIGALVGAAIYKQLRSDTVKIRQLEEKLQTLRHEHEDYQQRVHAHFNTSADLIHKLTDSYRDVYKHLAISAQTLCPENISSQLSLSLENQRLLEQNHENPDQSELFGEGQPPRDYADKAGPDAKGSLSEDYGLSKVHRPD